MTRDAAKSVASASSPGGALGRRSRIAAIHEIAGRVRVVVVSAGSPCRYVDSTELAAGDDAGLAAFIRKHKAGRIVRVVPACEVTARATPIDLPSDSDAEARSAALRLVAEAQAPGIPAHRVAGGIPPGSDSGPGSSALVTAWPARENGRLPDASNEAPADAWIAEPAALACLAPLGEGVRVLADPTTGGIGVICGGPRGLSVRALVGDTADPARWRSDVGRAVEEAQQAAGVPSDARTLVEGLADEPTVGLALFDDDAARAGVEGLPRAAGWIERYAVALGAAMSAGSEDPLVRALAELAPTPPRGRGRPLRTVTDWLRDPAHSMAVIAAALLVALLAPLAFASARVAILDARLASLEIGADEDERLARHAALYSQLEESRWSMTKLLADIAAAAPVGVQADSVRIDRRQGVRVSGSAESDSLVTQFQRRLSELGVFQAVRPESVESSASGGAEFTLAAEVARPHHRPSWPDDFAEQPLAVRLHGEGATNEAFEPGGGSSSATPRSRFRASPSPTRRGSTNDDGGSDRRLLPEREVGASSDDVPPALTDEEIEGMSMATAMKGWATRRNYLKANADAPGELRTRLEEEVEKLQAHFKSLQSGGGG